MKNNIRSFNKMHTYFLSKAGKLYETKKGKRVIANYIKMIKENAILKKQFDLYCQIEEGVSSYIKENAKEEYVNEIITSFNDITKKQIKEANHKLFWFLLDNNVITETENPWGTKTLNEEKDDWEITKSHTVFNCVDYLLYEGKNDLSLFIENKKRLAENLHVKDKKSDENLSLDDKVKDFNEKYRGKLTNEELNLITSLALSTNNQKTALVEYQKSIIKSIDELFKSTEDVEIKNKYLQLKEQILFEDYSDIKNATKLFEFRQVLDDIKNNIK